MKIGDSVSVVNDKLKGKIVSLTGNKVTIEDEHGFPYEYNTQEVVVFDSGIYNQIRTVQKEELYKPVSKKHDKKPMVLDLHFESVAKGAENVDAFERLFLQKSKLLYTLEYCRNNNLKRLEIIHGIGDGVLQQMVVDVLESQTNLEFHNKEILHHQSGTVMVYFR